MAVLILVAPILAATVPAAAREPYPSRPITVVAPFPPGGVADLTAQPMAAALEVRSSWCSRRPAGSSGDVC